MRTKTLKHVLKKDGKSASYCCQAAVTIKASHLPKEDAFQEATSEEK